MNKLNKLLHFINNIWTLQTLVLSVSKIFMLFCNQILFWRDSMQEDKIELETQKTFWKSKVHQDKLKTITKLKHTMIILHLNAFIILWLNQANMLKSQLLKKDLLKDKN